MNRSPSHSGWRIVLARVVGALLWIKAFPERLLLVGTILLLLILQTGALNSLLHPGSAETERRCVEAFGRRFPHYRTAEPFTVLVRTERPWASLSYRTTFLVGERDTGKVLGRVTCSLVSARREPDLSPALWVPQPLPPLTP